jgi:hypothetical protein
MGWQEDIIKHYEPIWAEEDLKRKAERQAEIAAQKAAEIAREQAALTVFAEKISKLIMADVDVSNVSRQKPYGKFQATLDNVRFFEDSFLESYTSKDMFGEEPDETQLQTVDTLRMEITCPMCGHKSVSMNNKTIKDSSHVAALLHNVNKCHKCVKEEEL